MCANHNNLYLYVSVDSDNANTLAFSVISIKKS